MIKKLILLFTFIVITSCESKKIAEREILAIDWILLVPKPVVCYPYDMNRDGTIYFLVNAERGTYMTGRIKLDLPDTIK